LITVFAETNTPASVVLQMIVALLLGLKYTKEPSDVIPRIPVEVEHLANSVALRPLVFRMVEVVPPLPINLADSGITALALWFERKDIVERKRARIKHRVSASLVFSLLSILGSC
jgi:hypothetical protein